MKELKCTVCTNEMCDNLDCSNCAKCLAPSLCQCTRQDDTFLKLESKF